MEDEAIVNEAVIAASIAHHQQMERDQALEQMERNVALATSRLSEACSALHDDESPPRYDSTGVTPPPSYHREDRRRFAAHKSSDGNYEIVRQ